MGNKKSSFKISLNELNIVEDDPTILRSKCIIFDFEESGNRQVISKDIAEENMNTLIGKRISCKYIRREDNSGYDALGSHEEYIGIDRDGNETILVNTEAVGFIENVYIDTYVDKDGNEKEAVFGDIVLWNDDKYKDIVGLLKEWIENGISINMSCEYYYFNYTVKDGIEYIQSPIYFNAHTLLNSEDRGDMLEVLPAYECATLISINQVNMWNKAVSQLDIKNKKNNKEDNKLENKFLKTLNEMCFGDIEWEIYYNKLAEVMTAKEYESVCISKWCIYPDFFIYDVKEGDEWVTYTVNYTIGEDDEISIDYENRKRIEYELIEKEVSLASANALKESNKKVEELTKELEDSKNELEKITKEKEDIEKSLNESNAKAIDLQKQVTEKSNNSKEEKTELENKINELQKVINNMQPMVDKYNEAEFNKRFEESKNEFKPLFENAGCIEKFEENETQELLKQYSSLDEEVKTKALNSLNAMIVKNMKVIIEKDDDDIMQDDVKISVNSIKKTEKNEALLKDNDGVEDYFGLQY